jgi:BlaI family transcriptional regulator, penicillinase repressor
MKRKTKAAQGLSDAEWVVMHCIWKFQRTSVREVFEELQAEQDWAYNTVRTMMERLRDKGFLAVKKAGNMYFYTPTRSQRSVSAHALLDFADKVFEGTVGTVFSQLIEKEKLSDEELADIMQQIERRKGK